MDLPAYDLEERSRASTAETDVKEGGDERARSLLVSAASGCFAMPVVPGRRYVVGRALECDIVIDDASVSRRHAAVTIDDPSLIEDLGSTNGTNLQGRRILPGTKARIDFGVAVEVGSATLVLHRSPEAQPPETTANPGAPPPMVVRDPAVQRLNALVDTVAPTMLSVMLLGETGVGKEVFAEALVRRSTRRNAPFVRLNCAALPETLLEAELFGSEKGAFTGATHSKKGLFEAADGGTLFLDEIGEMSAGTQTKLLRALESGEVLRLGSSVPRKVDVRFVSASNRDLRQLASAGSFRADLFFRLNGITLTIPPLRARPADILPLAHHFLTQAAISLGRRPPSLSGEAESMLQAHPWPGNVRELRNVIQRAAVLCFGSRILPEHLLLQEESGETPVPGSVEIPPEQATLRLPVAAMPVALRGAMDQVERQQLLAALEQTHGNQTRAAALLGIARRTLIKKMIRHRIERPRAGIPGEPDTDPEAPKTGR